MLLDGRALGTNLSGKVHLLEEVMVFSLSPPPAKYSTNPYTPFQFSFKYANQQQLVHIVVAFRANDQLRLPVFFRGHFQLSERSKLRF